MDGRAPLRTKRRLARAIELRCAVVHPNLAGARRGRDEHGRPAAILTVSPEPTLFELLESGPLSPARAVQLVGGVAAALDALAAAGLLGRDLTPERVHLDPRRGGILADAAVPFDVVEPDPVDLDEHAAFRSPEQLSGDPVSPRSNVYSLGVLLYTALVGSPPFGGTWSHVYVGHLDAERPRPTSARRDLPAAIDAVVARAMAIDPAERFETASDLGRAAATALDVPVPAAIEPEPETAAPELVTAPELVPAPALAPAPEPVAKPTPKRAPARKPARASQPARAPKPAASTPKHPQTKPARPKPVTPSRKPAPATGTQPAERPAATAPAATAPAATAAPATGPQLVRSAPPARRATRRTARRRRGAQHAVAVVPLELEVGDIEAVVPAVVRLAELEERAETSDVVVELKPRPSTNGHSPSTNGDAPAAPAKRVRAVARPGRRGLRTGAVIAVGAVSLAGAATVLAVTTDQQGDAPSSKSKAPARSASGPSSLTAPSAARQPLAPDTVRSVLEQLGVENLEGRRRLARAKFAEGQARAARGLAASYRSAAARIDTIDSVTGPAAAQLAATLNGMGDRYGQFAAAIADVNQEGYDVARLAIIDLEEQLARDESAALAESAPDQP